MKNLWPVHISLLFGVLSVIFGMMLISDTYQSRMKWNEIEKLRAEKEELNIEYTQLQLEESMLATGVVLDTNIRAHLDMVIPDPTTVVYIQNEISPNTIAKNQFSTQK